MLFHVEAMHSGKVKVVKGTLVLLEQLIFKLHRFIFYLM